MNRVRFWTSLHCLFICCHYFFQVPHSSRLTAKPPTWSTNGATGSSPSELETYTHTHVEESCLNAEQLPVCSPCTQTWFKCVACSCEPGMTLYLSACACVCVSLLSFRYLQSRLKVQYSFLFHFVIVQITSEMYQNDDLSHDPKKKKVFRGWEKPIWKREFRSGIIIF